MTSVTIEEAQAKLPEIIQHLLPGEEITITDQGEPLAQVKKTELSAEPRLRPPPGLVKRMITAVSDDDGESIVPSLSRSKGDAAECASVEGSGDHQREEAQRWIVLLAATLIKWEETPEMLDDGEGDSPSIEVIWRAVNGARSLLAAGRSAPTRIVPTANGAISFEWQNGSSFESLTFDDARLPEWKQFRSGQLVARQRVQ